MSDVVTAAIEVVANPLRQPAAELSPIRLGQAPGRDGVGAPTGSTGGSPATPRRR